MFEAVGVDLCLIGRTGSGGPHHRHARFPRACHYRFALSHVLTDKDRRGTKTAEGRRIPGWPISPTAIAHLTGCYTRNYR
jgi:hypothetical protein